MKITFTDRLPDGCFMCWLGDYDLDITTGYGRTKEEAEADLWDQLGYELWEGERHLGNARD